MRPPRYSLAGMLAVVLVAAIGMAGLRYASYEWASGIFLLTCATLALSIVGVVCRQGPLRAWWLGYAVFGWGYMALAFGSRPAESHWPMLPTTLVSRLARDKIGPPPGAPGTPAKPDIHTDPFFHVGHCLGALL